MKDPSTDIPQQNQDPDSMRRANGLVLVRHGGIAFICLILGIGLYMVLRNPNARTVSPELGGVATDADVVAARKHNQVGMAFDGQPPTLPAADSAAAEARRYATPTELASGIESSESKALPPPGMRSDAVHPEVDKHATDRAAPVGPMLDGRFGPKTRAPKPGPAVGQEQRESGAAIRNPRDSSVRPVANPHSAEPLDPDRGDPELHGASTDIPTRFALPRPPDELFAPLLDDLARALRTRTGDTEADDAAVGKAARIFLEAISSAADEALAADAALSAVSKLASRSDSEQLQWAYQDLLEFVCSRAGARSSARAVAYDRMAFWAEARSDSELYFASLAGLESAISEMPAEVQARWEPARRDLPLRKANFLIRAGKGRDALTADLSGEDRGKRTSDYYLEAIANLAESRNIGLADDENEAMLWYQVAYWSGEEGNAERALQALESILHASDVDTSFFPVTRIRMEQAAIKHGYHTRGYLEELLALENAGVRDEWWWGLESAIANSAYALDRKGTPIIERIGPLLGLIDQEDPATIAWLELHGRAEKHASLLHLAAAAYGAQDVRNYDKAAETWRQLIDLYPQAAQRLGAHERLASVLKGLEFERRKRGEQDENGDK